MAKVKFPLLSGSASGQLGKGVIFRKGGIVSRYFIPKNPNSEAQKAQRDYFKKKWVGAFMNHGNQQNLLNDDHPQYLTPARADARYLQSVPQQDHGGLAGLADDDHPQYLTAARGDARYLQEVPEITHSGLSGLANDDHPQYLTAARGNALYEPIGGGAGIALDGWTESAEVWTYASASSFLVAGDVRSIYRKGTRIKLTQTTVKYFVVIGVTYAGGNTTVRVAGHSATALINAAITLRFYSYLQMPFDFPEWFTYSSAVSGFGDGTPINFLFMVNGSWCTFYCPGKSGTSNSTDLRFQLPVMTHALGGFAYAVRGVNNGVNLTSPVYAYGAGNNNYVVFYKDFAAGLFTASGTKTVFGFSGVYMI